MKVDCDIGQEITCYIETWLRFSPQHDIGAEHAVFIEKPAVTAIFFRNPANGLDAGSLALSFGGLKDAVFLFDAPVKSIFHR